MTIIFRLDGPQSVIVRTVKVLLPVRVLKVAFVQVRPASWRERLQGRLQHVGEQVDIFGLGASRRGEIPQLEDEDGGDSVAPGGEDGIRDYGPLTSGVADVQGDDDDDEGGVFDNFAEGGG